MMSNKYVKKPIIVEAVQVVDGNRETVHKIYELGIGDKLSGVSVSPIDNSIEFFVETLEGRMKGHQGDWIVKGIQGEFYIVKDGIFKETYEKFEEECQQD